MGPFRAPHLLLLVVVPLALAVAYVVAQAQRTRYALRFTDLDLLDEVAPERPGWRRHLPAAALLLALLALVLGLARPVRAERVPVELATVVLALDTSISMQATDVEPDRIRAAQQAARRFLEEVPEQVRVGLVAFAGAAVPVVPPTTDRELVRRAVDGLTLQEGTAIGEAIAASVELVRADLARLEAAGGLPDGADDEDGAPIPATIVVLSDGDTTVGRPNSSGVTIAREAGLPVNTIAFGTDRGFITYQGQIVPVPANRPALRAVAEDTGGRAFDAASAEQLADVFTSLGTAVGFETEDRDVSGVFMAAALVLGSAAGAGSLRWFSRLP